MSAPVDVLAVLRRHAEAHRSLAGSDAYSAQEAPRLEDARDAVAELIAADEALQRIRREGASHAEHEASIRAHDAALARVQGGAA